MIFGEIPVGEAQGAVLAHSVKAGQESFKKGRVLSASDVALLVENGIASVFAARLGSDDVPEDEAAAAVARAIAGEGAVAQSPFTGRANLHAASPGVALIDGARVRDLNRLHESLTLATVAPFDQVEERQLVATVKVIPFAVPRNVLERALAIIGSDPVISVRAFEAKRVGLVITRLPHMKPSLIEKSESSMRDRVAALGGSLDTVLTVPHRIADVAEAIRILMNSGCSPLLVFGASAIVDRGDVIPAAVVAAGGEVVHLGMPVDPGNLMMLARHGGTPVLGVPSCARSPKLNGFDWVLQRLMADVPVSAEDVMAMGAGGLLKEISSRPSPRESAKPQRAPRVWGILLAAGTSSRMGARNKLTIPFHGKPMVRLAAEALKGAKLAGVIAVTGHEADAVGLALDGLGLRHVHNAAYASGLASSLRAGLAALPVDADAALIALGDMPLVKSADIDRLIAAFNPAEHRSICVPTAEGRRGNPVLWGRQHFEALSKLEGDGGAKPLMRIHADEVVDVAFAGEAVLTDFDTPESLPR